MIVLKYTEMRIYCQRQRCSPRSVVSGDIHCILCRYSSGFADEVVSNESAVVENAIFLCRSLYLPYEVPHWLYKSKFTRLRAETAWLLEA